MTPYYSQDGIQIYLGDCRDVLPRVGRVDVVLTDPPYGVGFGYGSEYVDSSEGYREWIESIFVQIMAASDLVALTPGIANLWLYPPASWVLCWAKPGSPRRSRLGGFNAWEPILLYGKRRIYNDLIVLPAWNNTTKDSGNHPCPKPLALYTWLVSETSDVGGLVLDPFMGSGTTLRAAKDLGRRAIGIEIEERYCEIAARRLSQSVMFGAEVA